MRLFSRFVPPFFLTLALCLLSLTLARPANTQDTTPEQTIQFIALQQDLIRQANTLERLGEGVMYLETLALLAEYGGWSRYDAKIPTAGAKRIENLKLLERIAAMEPDRVYAMAAAKRNKSASEDDLARFAAIDQNLEDLISVSVEVHDLLENSGNSRIDQANALYRDKSIPLINAITADTFTLISGFEDKITKATRQSLLAK